MPLMHAVSLPPGSGAASVHAMTTATGASFTEPATAADARAGDLSGITVDRPRVIVDVNLLLRDADRILLGLRRGGFADGMYSLPAGHLELGESVRDALIREAREETGIIIAAADARFVQVMHNSYGIGRMAFFFEARTWTGDITNREPDKCQELCWFPARCPA
jgi:8-oxo-dGTP diphosphatase